MLVMHPGHLVPLLPLMLLILLLQTASVLSSPATHVYPPNCAPPDSAVEPTPTSLVPYTGYLPIERCCPQVYECQKNGGFCALDWLVRTVLPGCDIVKGDVCKDYGCSCCIKCSQDKCNKCTESDGNCRKKCRSDESVDLFNLCTHEDCQCCRKCSMMDECREANGICVAHFYNCPGGTHASSGCCGGCYCCKPELERLNACESKKGFCSSTDECPTGYYSCFGECEAKQFVNGLQQTIVGYCCAPKIPTNTSRRITAFNYYMNNVGSNSLSDYPLVEGEIQSEELNDISPQLNDDGSAQDDVEKVVEEQIYDQVVPAEVVEDQIYDQVVPAEVVEDQIYDEVVPAEVVEDQIYDEVVPAEKQGDAAMAIDSPMDIPDAAMTIDSPINIPDDDMAIDSPIDISDQVFYLQHQDDENNNEVEKTKHHRRPHHNNEINDEVEKRKHHRKHTESKN